jgi:hypothetical protein
MRILLWNPIPVVVLPARSPVLAIARVRSTPEGKASAAAGVFAAVRSTPEGKTAAATGVFAAVRSTPEGKTSAAVAFSLYDAFELRPHRESRRGRVIALGG